MGMHGRNDMFHNEAAGAASFFLHIPVKGATIAHKMMAYSQEV